MSGFDFVSPGAAFVGGVTDFLDNQKKLQRQAMLDNLQVNADRRATEAAALQKQEAEQRMADERQNAEITKLNSILPFLDAGQDISGLSQDTQDLLRKHNAVRDVTQPAKPMPIIGLGGTPIGAAPLEKPTTISTYAGSPVERQHDKEVKAFGDSVIQTLLSSSNPIDQQKGRALVIDAMVNHGLPASSTVAKLMEPDAAVVTYDENTNKYYLPSGKQFTGDTLPAGTTIKTRGYTPEHSPRQWINVGEDKDGNTVLFDPNSRQTQTLPGVHKATTAKNGLDKFSIPGYAANPLNDTITAINADPDNITDEMVTNYRSRAATAIATSHVARPLMNLATEFVNNPRQYYDHAAQLVDAGKLSKDDVDTLAALTDAIAPYNIKDMLIARPYQPHVKKPGLMDRFKNAYGAAENYIGRTDNFLSGKDEDNK